MSKVYKQDEIHECCICHQMFIGWGNNPFPVDLGYKSVCCDKCNSEIVIPKRIEMMKAKINKETANE